MYSFHSFLCQYTKQLTRANDFLSPDHVANLQVNLNYVAKHPVRIVIFYDVQKFGTAVLVCPSLM